jgi:hypothetical protein
MEQHRKRIDDIFASPAPVRNHQGEEGDHIPVPFQVGENALCAPESVGPKFYGEFAIAVGVAGGSCCISGLPVGHAQESSAVAGAQGEEGGIRT